MLREQADILARAGVDLIVLERMRDVDYAAGAVDAARATGLPVWIGFSCRRASDASVRMFAGDRSRRTPRAATSSCRAGSSWT